MKNFLKFSHRKRTRSTLSGETPKKIPDAFASRRSYSSFILPIYFNNLKRLTAAKKKFLKFFHFSTKHFHKTGSP